MIVHNGILFIRKKDKTMNLEAKYFNLKDILLSEVPRHRNMNSSFPSHI